MTHSGETIIWICRCRIVTCIAVIIVMRQWIVICCCITALAMFHWCSWGCIYIFRWARCGWHTRRIVRFAIIIIVTTTGTWTANRTLTWWWYYTIRWSGTGCIRCLLMSLLLTNFRPTIFEPNLQMKKKKFKLENLFCSSWRTLNTIHMRILETLKWIHHRKIISAWKVLQSSIFMHQQFK